MRGEAGEGADMTISRQAKAAATALNIRRVRLSDMNPPIDVSRWRYPGGGGPSSTLCADMGEQDRV
jgi:hypothetical protein